MIHMMSIYSTDKHQYHLQYCCNKHQYHLQYCCDKHQYHLQYCCDKHHYDIFITLNTAALYVITAILSAIAVYIIVNQERMTALRQAEMEIDVLKQEVTVHR